MAASLSAILGLWFTAVANAKVHDPNRPTYDRQVAHKKLIYFMQEMVRNFLDDSRHETYFPGQKWSDPFDATDRGGSFV
jgi:hypothetical protein